MVFELSGGNGDSERVKDKLPAVGVAGDKKLVAIFLCGFNYLLARLVHQQDFEIGRRRCGEDSIELPG